MTVRAELLEARLLPDREHMVVWFRDGTYHDRTVARMKDAAGGRFVGPASGGPGYKYKLTMDICGKLRSALGDGIHFSDEILNWGKAEVDRRIDLVQLGLQHDTDDLPVLKEKNPDLLEWFRGYQRVGARWVADCHPGGLIADHPGLGKTSEVIAGIIEAGLDNGPNLIVCPRPSIADVWLPELVRIQKQPVFIAPEGKREREQLLSEVELCLEMDEPFWVVVNFHMLTYRKTKDSTDEGVYDPVSGEYFKTQFPFLMRQQWNTIVVDEAQDSGLSTPSTATARALANMTSRKRLAMSGTPMGGKHSRLWGILHWIDPKVFDSRKKWEDKWIVKEKKQRKSDGQIYVVDKGVPKEREEEFYEAHAHYILRRKKSDPWVLPHLPPKIPVDHTVDMTELQAKQYAMMEENAWAQAGEIDPLNGLQVSNALTTQLWLTQFSFGVCDVVQVGERYDAELDVSIPKFKAKATQESPKLAKLLEILHEAGVDDRETGQQAIVFSRYVHVVEAVRQFLEQHHFKVGVIKGGDKRDDRSATIKAFQGGGDLQVMVVSTKAGGVSINLDRADDVIFMDETWNPDDKEQAEDRAHRASRIHQVRVHTVRTKGTVDMDIMKANKDKANANAIVLDRYRLRRAEGIQW